MDKVCCYTTLKQATHKKWPLCFTHKRFTLIAACGELTASHRWPPTHIMRAHDAHCVRSWRPPNMTWTWWYSRYVTSLSVSNYRHPNHSRSPWWILIIYKQYCRRTLQLWGTASIKWQTRLSIEYGSVDQERTQFLEAEKHGEISYTGWRFPWKT